MPYYPYGIKCRESQRNTFIANNFYDAGDVTAAYYRFDSTSGLNYVLAGFHDDLKPFVEDHATNSNRSTVINFHQAQESRYAQGVRFLGDVTLEPKANGPSPYGPKVVSTAGAELTYQLSNGSGMTVWYTPEGGSPVPLSEVRDDGGGTVVHELKGTDARVRNVNGSLKVQSAPGSPLELGDTSGAALRIEDREVELVPTGARILSGSGPPTEAAPNGSIYLRTDGGPGTTLYVREAGAWVPK
jgi:hypothetical protein